MNSIFQLHVEFGTVLLYLFILINAGAEKFCPRVQQHIYAKHTIKYSV